MADVIFAVIALITQSDKEECYHLHLSRCSVAKTALISSKVAFKVVAGKRLRKCGNMRSNITLESRVRWFK